MATIRRAHAATLAGASCNAACPSGRASCATSSAQNAAGLDVEGLDDLLERLLQVRIGDYDARGGWRSFDDVRRALRRAETEGERYHAAAVGRARAASSIDDSSEQQHVVV